MKLLLKLRKKFFAMINAVNLKVPLYQQEPDSNDCQTMCVQMILHYYGDMASLDEIMLGLQPYMVEKTGMHSEGPAIWLAKRGYDVQFIVHDYDLMDRQIKGVTDKDVEKLKAKLAKITERADERDKYRLEKLPLLIELINAGVKFSSDIPTLKVIDDLLSQQVPVKIGVDARVLRTDPWRKGGHSVVVVGKDGADYILNDPSPNSEGNYSIGPNQLLMAWYMGGARTTVIMQAK